MKVLIPFKSNSIRLKEKYKKLLPYTLKFLKRYDLDVVIITDKDAVSYTSWLLEKMNVKAQIYEEIRDNYSNEILSIYNYLEKNPDIKEFIWLNITNPCRDLSLINKVLSIPLDKFKLVTSFTNIPDRSIFEVETNISFKIKNIERTGSKCESKSVADGAIYYTTAEFIKECVEAIDLNEHFWNTNTYFVYNEAPLIDVDYQSDLDQLENIKYLYESNNYRK